MWAFSFYLEAVAIIPQLHFVSKAGRSEKIVDYYICGLMQYRVFHIMNWETISSISGIVQCIIYVYFFSSVFSIKSKYMYIPVPDSSQQPIYVISANDLPKKENKESDIPVEKV